MKKTDVVVVGAGPYGLSIGAHLRGAGVNFRIFGDPMHTWRHQMPRGMRLKSEGFASSLDDPKNEFTLEAYCKEKNLPYQHVGLPVPLETFTQYGLEFQRRYVPELEDKNVESIRHVDGGFQVLLSDGEVVSARRVVLAVGITHYAYTPESLAALGEQYVSHSSIHSTLDHFRGKHVLVIGGGASAVDLAALLHEAGIKTEIIARREKIRFHDEAPNPRPLMDRLRWPLTGIGAGWNLVFCAHMPWLFRLMPQSYRLDAVRRILGPAPGWFVKKQVVGKVPMHLSSEVTDAKTQNGKISLTIKSKNGETKTLTGDHVVAATGYRVDLKKLAFLDTDLQTEIASVEQTPLLDTNFESSVPGLYFVGVAAANTFGPLLRFAFGSQFTARRIVKHLAAGAVHNLEQAQPVAKTEKVERKELVTR